MTSQTTQIYPAEKDDLEVGHKAQELRVGTVLWGRYKVMAVLGSSELGELWRCLDLESDKEVSLRWLPPDLRRSKQVMAVIHAGIRRLSDQTHPNLAAIRQMVYVGEQIYLVGDFAPGVDIGTWGRAGAGGKRSLGELLPILRQVAEALDFAHRKRIVHRNLKPSDVFLGADGVVRVTDFGLAPHHHMTIVHGKAVRMGTTGPYLAPELREGDEPDSASDQYALAVLAWNLLAGAPPAGPDAAWEPPTDLPGSVRSGLRRGMARKPRNRFVSCADFVRALGGEHIGGRRGRTAAEWSRIRFFAEVAVALVILGMCLGFGGYNLILWLNRPPDLGEVKIPPKTVELAKPKPAMPEHAPVARLVAATPLPVEGQPWVAQTVQMEFVWVPAMQLWVGRFEVANEEYLQKDPEHDSGDFRGLSLNGSRQPVVRVNFDDAVAYAAWLTEQERAAGKLPEGWHYRLPSIMEAITYTRSGSLPAYPWGEMFPPTRGNYADSSLETAFPDMQSISGYLDGFPTTATVESSGENQWGLFGAGGNVWETTSKTTGGSVFGGWQGGGWDDYLPARMKCDMFYGFIGNASGAVNGFRLVLAPMSGEAQPPPTAAASPAPAPED